MPSRPDKDGGTALPILYILYSINNFKAIFGNFKKYHKMLKKIICSFPIDNKSPSSLTKNGKISCLPLLFYFSPSTRKLTYFFLGLFSAGYFNFIKISLRYNMYSDAILQSRKMLKISLNYTFVTDIYRNITAE